MSCSFPTRLYRHEEQLFLVAVYVLSRRSELGMYGDYFTVKNQSGWSFGVFYPCCSKVGFDFWASERTGNSNETNTFGGARYDTPMARFPQASVERRHLVEEFGLKPRDIAARGWERAAETSGTQNFKRAISVCGFTMTPKHDTSANLSSVRSEQIQLA